MVCAFWFSLSLCVCVGKWRQDFLLWVLDPNWIQPASIDHVVVVVASLFFFSPTIQTNSHSDDRSRSSTRHAIGGTCSGLYVWVAFARTDVLSSGTKLLDAFPDFLLLLWRFSFLLIPTRPYKEMEEDKELLHHSFLWRLLALPGLAWPARCCCGRPLFYDRFVMMKFKRHFFLFFSPTLMSSRGLWAFVVTSARGSSPLFPLFLLLWFRFGSLFFFHSSRPIVAQH